MEPEPEPEPPASNPAPAPEPEPEPEPASAAKAPEPPARRTMNVTLTVYNSTQKAAAKTQLAEALKTMDATVEKVQIASAVSIPIDLSEIKEGSDARKEFESNFQKGYTDATGLPCKVTGVTGSSRRLLGATTRRQLGSVSVAFYSEVPKSMATKAASLAKTAKEDGMKLDVKVGAKSYNVELAKMAEPTVTYAPKQDCVGAAGTCKKTCKSTFTQTQAQSGTGKACAHPHNSENTCSGGSCSGNSEPGLKSGAASTAASLALVC